MVKIKGFIAKNEWNKMQTLVEKTLADSGLTVASIRSGFTYEGSRRAMFIIGNLGHSDFDAKSGWPNICITESYPSSGNYMVDVLVNSTADFQTPSGLLNKLNVDYGVPSARPLPAASISILCEEVRIVADQMRAAYDEAMLAVSGVGGKMDLSRAGAPSDIVYDAIGEYIKNIGAVASNRLTAEPSEIVPEGVRGALYRQVFLPAVDKMYDNRFGNDFVEETPDL